MSRINLTDDADTIMQKVKKAKTDPEPLPSEKAGLEGRPEAANLVASMRRWRAPRAEVLGEFGGQGFGKFKPALGELLAEKLAPINARFVDLRQDQARSMRSWGRRRKGPRAGHSDAGCGLPRAGTGARLKTRKRKLVWHSNHAPKAWPS